MSSNGCGSVGKSTRRHVRWPDREIERLDEEYKELLKCTASLSENIELYQTVPGVGQLTAATLVAYLPELGRWDGRALTSLVGLAPWSRDSEKKCGNKSIRGGRGTVRRALYISVPGWCSGQIATYATSIGDFGSAANPARWL